MRPAPIAEIACTVAGEAVRLLSARALYWPARRTLAVADLHWGKAETFQAFGIPVPSGDLALDLARLDAAVRATGAERLLLLGDLIHGAWGLTAQVVDQAAEWLTRCPAEAILVEGNHDQHVAALPDAWALPVLPSLRDGPFRFCHAPAPDPQGAYVWAGHVHPVAVIRGRRRRGRVRLPIFHVGAQVGVLPAFGAFTGGAELDEPGARRYGVADGQLIAL